MSNYKIYSEEERLSLLREFHDSKGKAIYILEDLIDWLCNNDVYEITINGITNETFISAAAIKALIGKMRGDAEK